jgi:hypothetical protein
LRIADGWPRESVQNRQRHEIGTKEREGFMKTTRNTQAAAKRERRDDAAKKTEQKSFLKKRLREHAKVQPEILDLQKILLAVGGKQLDAPPSVTQDIPFLIESGFVMDYPVTERIMQPNMCHLNSAELFAAGEATALCTGFALFGGLWTQHSWALERQEDGTNRILETTGKRERYFGILLWGMFGKFAAMTEFEINGIDLPASLAMLPSFTDDPTPTKFA